MKFSVIQPLSMHGLGTNEEKKSKFTYICFTLILKHWGQTKNYWGHGIVII